MTDKQKIRNYACELLKDSQNGFGSASYNMLKMVIAYIDSLPKEPVSEDLKTESMIESYKQRLISQANGMKNSPLIDMCLVSYKHGINETLDTLKLSNIERTVKNWEEPVSDELEKAINFYVENNFFGSETLGFFSNRTKEEPNDQDIALAFKAGARWQKQQMMAKAFEFTKEHNTACILASECLRNHGWFGRERDFNNLFRHLSCVDELFQGKFSGKTKVIVIKED